MGGRERAETWEGEARRALPRASAAAAGRCGVRGALVEVEFLGWRQPREMETTGDSGDERPPPLFFPQASNSDLPGPFSPEEKIQL